MSNDHKNQQFKTDIGINATVKRVEANADISAKPNRMLVDLGQSFQEIEQFQLKGYTYFGSAAVHIYAHEMLNLLDFVSQTQALELFRCPQPLASRAFDDLLGNMKTMYGARRSKVRSGF